MPKFKVVFSEKQRTFIFTAVDMFEALDMIGVDAYPCSIFWKGVDGNWVHGMEVSMSDKLAEHLKKELM